MSDLDIVYVSSSSTETIENGSIEYPFRTIQLAFENLNSGGTMRLKCGDIRNCRQAFECFANRLTSEGNIAYPFSNCRFSNNICIGSGISEFKTTQEQDAHIDWGARDMVVKDNVFIEGNYHFYARNQPNVFDGNICYIREGQLLVSHVWHWQGWTPICYPVESDSSTWISGSSSYSQAVSNAISAYQLITGDTTTIFYRITD